MLNNHNWAINDKFLRFEPNCALSFKVIFKFPATTGTLNIANGLSKGVLCVVDVGLCYQVKLAENHKFSIAE